MVEVVPAAALLVITPLLPEESWILLMAMLRPLRSSVPPLTASAEFAGIALTPLSVIVPASIWVPPEYVLLAASETAPLVLTLNLPAPLMGPVAFKPPLPVTLMPLV